MGSKVKYGSDGEIYLSLVVIIFLMKCDKMLANRSIDCNKFIKPDRLMLVLAKRGLYGLPESGKL